MSFIWQLCHKLTDHVFVGLFLGILFYSSGPCISCTISTLSYFCSFRIWSQEQSFLQLLVSFCQAPLGCLGSSVFHMNLTCFNPISNCLLCLWDFSQPEQSEKAKSIMSPHCSKPSLIAGSYQSLLLILFWPHSSPCCFWDGRIFPYISVKTPFPHLPQILVQM